MFPPNIFRILDLAIKFPFAKNILQQGRKITSSKFTNITDGFLVASANIRA